MTVLSAQSIRARVGMISPMEPRTTHGGVTYGLGPAGYDIRIRQSVTLFPGEFRLASAVEVFAMPDDVMGILHDKSSNIRRGLLVGNSIIEPGFVGGITLELFLSRDARDRIHLPAGSGVAHCVFHRLDEPTEAPYRGKYQGQTGEHPVAAIMEGE